MFHKHPTGRRSIADLIFSALWYCECLIAWQAMLLNQREMSYGNFQLCVRM